MRLKILVVLTYYRPHTSGLTIYAERLARALVRRGHSVTVLTSQFDKSLPAEETRDGVRIIRAPVLFRVSKGVIMPTFGVLATRLAKEHDAIHLHLPQFDAAGVALRGRWMKKPTVITYHCDLQMPSGFHNRIVNLVVDVMNHLAARFTHRIVTYTRDYAENSRFLKTYLHKLNVILPPVEVPPAGEAAIKKFAGTHNPANAGPVIGMAARFASEKGVEVLLNAMDTILKVHPETLVQFAGPYQNIIGEEAYSEKLMPVIERYQREGHWRFLGTLDPDEMARFYSNIDVLVLPSLNSTEAFGLVQIEAMLHQVPAVASNLPGVRQPVLMHKMGKISEIGNAGSLARAILDVLAEKDRYKVSTAELAGLYDPDRIAEAYEQMLDEIRQELAA
jgi:glycosyltransferase involved in cell wall biosynthesis